MSINSDLRIESSRDRGSVLRGFYPDRIAIVRALPGLGDMLCAVPAWRALRAALPAAEITLIGLPWARSFARRFKAYLDNFVEFPGYPGLPEQTPPIRQLPAFLAEVQAQAFDLAIQMQGSGLVSNPLTMLLGAQVTAGFFLPDQYCPDGRYFLPYPAHEAEVRRHLSLMAFLGIASQGESLEFPLDEADWQALAVLKETRSLSPGDYVCLHPGASTFERCWPPERFAAIGDELAAGGLKIVLTGSAQEAILTQAVKAKMRADCLDLAGRTSLGALAALLSQVRLVVCNDTGISHLAAALAVPSVVIFTQSDPARWAPLNRQRHRLVASMASSEPYREICRSTGRGDLCLGDSCLTLTRSLKQLPPTGVTVEMVRQHVEDLLGQKVGG